MTTRGHEKVIAYEPLQRVKDWASKYSASEEERPDVFVVAIEALRADALLGRNDPATIVPNLYKFSRNSLVFSTAYAAAPDTGYALKAIVSGRYSYEGELRHQNYLSDVSREVILFDLLHHVGYKTGYFTATDWSATARLMNRTSVETNVDSYQRGKVSTEDTLDRRDVNARGFEPRLIVAANDPAFMRSFGALDRATTKSFSNWIEATSTDTPLFGLVYLVSSHFPWIIEDSALKLFPAPEEAMMESLSIMTSGYRGELDVLKRFYGNALHQVDYFFGELVKGIQARASKKRVIVIVVGDHGEAVGQHGFLAHASSLYEEQVRVPLLVYDSAVQGLRLSDFPVSQVDIAPTVLDLIGLPPFNGHQTSSIKSKVLVEERDIYLSLQAYQSFDGLVSWPYKLISSIPTRKPQLFNLALDPYELKDIAHEFPDIAVTMSQKIENFKATQKNYYGVPRIVRGLTAPPSWRQKDSTPSAASRGNF
jgi:arylsulfatase A-like enzyme